MSGDIDTIELNVRLSRVRGFEVNITRNADRSEGRTLDQKGSFERDSVPWLLTQSQLKEHGSFRMNCT